MERLKYPNKSVAEIDRTYSLALNTTGIELTAAPTAWWEPYLNLLQHLNLTEEPWQERAAVAAIAETGADRFNGLDLFGCLEQFV